MDYAAKKVDGYHHGSNRPGLPLYYSNFYEAHIISKNHFPGSTPTITYCKLHHNDSNAELGGLLAPLMASRRPLTDTTLTPFLQIKLLQIKNDFIFKMLKIKK